MKLLVFAAAAVVLWADTPAAWTPELSMKIRPVGDVTPSPDGQWAAYTQTEAVMEAEKSESVTQIFLARADGGRRLQLTRAEKSSTAPAFSPDGRFVYFLSERSGKPNVWRIAVDGGEAECVTSWKGTIGAFRISPDGKWIAFAGAEPATDEEAAKKEKRDFRVVDEKPANHSLWLVSSEPGRGAARKLFPNTAHIGEFDWSPDSRRIAFERRPTPDADYMWKADLAEVELESGTVHSIATTGANEAEPRYSPDGKYLAYLRGPNPPTRPEGARILLLPRSGGAARVLPATPDEEPHLLAWTGDARLLFAEQKGIQQVIYAVPPDGPAQVLYRPSHGTLGRGSRVNTTGTHIGFAQESSSEAPEAFLARADGSAPRRVSRANLDLPTPPLGETKPLRWKAKDGMELEGLLTYPVGYAAGKKFPMILVIHGGPSGAFSDSFIGSSGLYPYAAFASRGYAVLRVNPRGSTGYGVKFRFANVNDWGGGDYRDLMDGVDHAIAMGVADPNRLAVMGWSYGGYMTNWVITQTKRFKAAAAGAGLSNIWSMWGTNDIPSFLDLYFLGQPAEKLDGYLKASPLYHIQNVTTPTLILHGEADIRVPTSQGYEMYHGLKSRGVPVKMVVYPRTPHGPREPKFVLDIMQRHLDWVDKYVR